VTNLQL